MYQSSFYHPLIHPFNAFFENINTQQTQLKSFKISFFLT